MLKLTRRNALGLAFSAAAAMALPQTALAGEAGAQMKDSDIFAIYDQVNGFDIDTAMLGVIRGQNREVRALAAMVLRDHSAVRQMTRSLAGKLGVEYKVDEQNASAKQHQVNIQKLKSLPAGEFDAAYLAHEIEFHSNAINAVKTVLLPNIRNDEFNQMVAAVLPGFEHHLAETEQVAKSLGTGG